MPNIKRANASGITKPGTAIADVPDTPTIGTATGGSEEATVTFTAAATGGTATTFTATSTPGSITGTAASSPITVSGLTNGTAYSFTVTATNSTGTSAASSASNQVTPVSLGDMDPIAMVEVNSSGASSIVFSSIPATYKHLQVRILSRDARSASLNNVHMRVNGDTGANYTYHTIYGDGSTVTSDGGTGSTVTDYIYEPSALVTASVFGTSIFDILDYTSTTKNKTIRMIGGYDANGAGRVNLTSSLWLNTSAITSLTFLNSSNNNFVQYSHFALYGIKGA